MPCDSVPKTMTMDSPELVEEESAVLVKENDSSSSKLGSPPLMKRMSSIGSLKRVSSFMSLKRSSSSKSTFNAMTSPTRMIPPESEIVQEERIQEERNDREEEDTRAPAPTEEETSKQDQIDEKAEDIAYNVTMDSPELVEEESAALVKQNDSSGSNLDLQPLMKRMSSMASVRRVSSFMSLKRSSSSKSTFSAMTSPARMIPPESKIVKEERIQEESNCGEEDDTRAPAATEEETSKQDQIDKKAEHVAKNVTMDSPELIEEESAVLVKENDSSGSKLGPPPLMKRMSSMASVKRVSSFMSLKRSSSSKPTFNAMTSPARMILPKNKIVQEESNGREREDSRAEVYDIVVSSKSHEDAAEVVSEPTPKTKSVNKDIASVAVSNISKTYNSPSDSANKQEEIDNSRPPERGSVHSEMDIVTMSEPSGMMTVKEEPEDIHAKKMEEFNQTVEEVKGILQRCPMEVKLVSFKKKEKKPKSAVLKNEQSTSVNSSSMKTRMRNFLGCKPKVEAKDAKTSMQAVGMGEKSTKGAIPEKPAVIEDAVEDNTEEEFTKGALVEKPAVIKDAAEDNKEEESTKGALVEQPAVMEDAVRVSKVTWYLETSSSNMSKEEPNPIQEEEPQPGMLIQDIVEFPKQFVKHAEEESIHAKDSTYFGPLVSFSMFVAKKVTDDINDTVKYCSNGRESVSDNKLATTTCFIKQEETAMENEGGGWMSDLKGFVEYIQGITKAENVQQESMTEQDSSEQSTQQPIQQSGSFESAF